MPLYKSGAVAAEPRRRNHALIDPAPRLVLAFRGNADRMDLTRDYPRGPREQLGGIALLPRAIDKGRAQLEGTLGEYVYYGCRLNLKLFNTLGVTEDEFLDAVRRSPDDAAMLEWIDTYVRPERSAVDQMNDWVLHNEPLAEDRQAFCDELEKIDPGNDYVNTWTDLIDLEEGRLKKESSTAT